MVTRFLSCHASVEATLVAKSDDGSQLTGAKLRTTVAAFLTAAPSGNRLVRAERHEDWNGRRDRRRNASMFLAPLLDALHAHGFGPETLAADKGDDHPPVYAECAEHGVEPIVPLRGARKHAARTRRPTVTGQPRHTQQSRDVYRGRERSSGPTIAVGFTAHQAFCCHRWKRRCELSPIAAPLHRMQGRPTHGSREALEFIRVLSSPYGLVVVFQRGVSCRRSRDRCRGAVGGLLSPDLGPRADGTRSQPRRSTLRCGHQRHSGEDRSDAASLAPAQALPQCEHADYDGDCREL
jgi:hypothetical protein